MATIIDKVKAAMTADGTPHVFGSWAQINLLLDKLRTQKQWPMAICLQPVGGSLITDGDYNPFIMEREHIYCGFADSIRLDYDPEQAQVKVEALKMRCKKLLSDLMASGDFARIEDATYSVLFDEMDANLVIVLVDFYLTEAEGVCM